MAFSCREPAAQDYDTNARILYEAVRWNAVVGHLLTHSSLLPGQCVDDAFNLLDMRLFMVCQPLGICLHGSFT